MEQPYLHDNGDSGPQQEAGAGARVHGATGSWSPRSNAREAGPVGEGARESCELRWQGRFVTGFSV